ncbi:branched-chain amino acid ABC transporter permease [Mycolicibacterium sp.]|uniref:branched-chain amino acid ABC transporter permease n=1 Tax=Mycolicibacterium sp. TaxID=2320850 RepID=UPI003D0D1BFD
MSEFMQYVANGLVTGAIYALMALGLTIIFGHMGVVNFAHGALYAFGAYIGFSVASASGLGFFAALVTGAVAIAIFGAAVQLGLLEGVKGRDPIMPQMLITIGLWLALQSLVIIIWGASPKRLESPLSGGSFNFGAFRLQSEQVLVVVLALALILLVHLWMQRTHSGLTMRATFQDKDAAWLAGINVRKVYAIGFGLGAGLAAMAGVLVASLSALTPGMGEVATAKAFAVVIVGGLGSFPGVVIAGIVLGIAESLTAGYISSGYVDAISMAVLLAVLMVRPEGLFGVRMNVKG